MPPSPRLASLLALACLACGTQEGAPSMPAAPSDAGAARVDPFCATRPRLAFCEDFDEDDLPGRFAAIEGDPALVARAPRSDAPSPPQAITVTHAAGSTDARLVFTAHEGVKFNLFFFLRAEPGHGRVEVAALEDGAYRLELGLTDDDRWYVTEHPGAEDGGAAPPPRTLATEAGPERGTFSSVRLDVYADGAGRGHLRLRSGDLTVYAAEPLAFGEGKAKLRPRVHVGARLLEGAPARVAFDTVTLGED